jgi:hypothetical protein
LHCRQGVWWNASMKVLALKMVVILVWWQSSNYQFNGKVVILILQWLFSH